MRGWRTARTYSQQSRAVVYELLGLAAEGKTADIEKLMQLGSVNVNSSDYDRRTALHLAASEGRTDTVKFLMAKGANVQAVDRFGGTPMDDALAARRSEIVRLLAQAGGQLAQKTEELAAQLIKAASVGHTDRLRDILENSDVSPGVADYDNRTALHLAAAHGEGAAVAYLLSRGADPRAEDRFGRTPVDQAREGGHAALAAELEAAPRPELEEPCVVHGGGATAQQSFLVRQHFHDVKEILMQSQIYSQAVIASELDWYYNHLELPEYYFIRFPPEVAAKHIEGYIAAKQVAEANGCPENIRIEGVESEDGAFFLCPNELEFDVQVESNIEQMIVRSEQEKDRDRALSVFHFVSRGAAVPHGTKRLSMYIVDKSRFANTGVDRKERSLQKTASENFFSWRKPHIIDQFQDMMDNSTDRISPHFQILPREGNTTHVMFAHRRDTHHLPLEISSQILAANGLQLRRKVIEPFSNGVTVHSMYFEPTADSHIYKALNDLSLMFIVRRSKDILPLYLSGELTATEYAYCSTAALFVYYFMFQDHEDLRVLLESLRHDPEKVARLENIRKLMKVEIVSLARIGQALNTYPEIVKDIAADFSHKFTPDEGGVAPTVSREDIRQRIAKEAENDQDQDILEQFVFFNEVCNKTNFFKIPKTAMSFRLDPSFLPRDPAYPDAPYAIIMMIGNDFHGFHVRFNDVARGGIRLVISPEKGTFSRNLETAFFENYNLAHTQNRKNKDIPEFGSKGVLLLRPRALFNPLAREQAFRKYISSMLDMLLPHPRVKNLLDREEILFLGPDENTADLMEWAALYSRKRKYPYWKAFTTGKPQSLGGIPHDTYGMTTQSVHQYVLEILKDAGVREEDVTKFQTGGPDGDLGSNEILISKDKTTAIVDGSGVLYDPQGLDRAELRRLATERQMISSYDTPLSPDGFKVLVGDTDVTLPDGTKVPGGVAFRNQFHLTPYSTADLFVPCGGRPEAVNSSNVEMLFHKDGSPRFKYIVEGANLFFTQEARSVLERRGVTLFKDASSNKGGVTSSSLEVLAALVLTDDEHAEHMCFGEGEPEPAFYKEYVEEVQRRIRENAVLEYRCLVAEHKRTNELLHLLTDQLSDKINTLNLMIADSPLYDQPELRNKVLGEAIPAQLQEIVPGGLEEILRRLPENYTKAMFSTYLSSRFVYKHGMGAGDFAFFEFMQDYLRS